MTCHKRQDAERMTADSSGEGAGVGLPARPDRRYNRLPGNTPLIARLWYYSTYELNQCYQWRGMLTPDGYGNIRVDARTEKVHRVAYELLVGTIPADLQIDHLCRNRACWNPEHLEPVTLHENVRRSKQALASANAKKTHCKRGHELAGANLMIGPAKTPGAVRRACRTCKRMTDQANNERRRAQKVGQ